MKNGAACGFLAVLVLVPMAALAQQAPEPPQEPLPEPFPAPSPAPSWGSGALGVVGLGGIPLGDFADAVGSGFGVSAYLAGPLHRGQPLLLRLEFSYLEYGSETVDATVAGTGGRVKTGNNNGLHVTTTSDFLRFALGPHVAARRGRLRPYAYATVGESYFSTTSKLDDDSYDEDAIATHTNCSDWTFSWSAGAGVLVHNSGEGFLDLGVRYLANRPVDWLASGDLVNDPMGPGAQPRHSAVNLLEIVVGFAAAAPR